MSYQPPPPQGPPGGYQPPPYQQGGYQQPGYQQPGYPQAYQQPYPPGGYRQDPTAVMGRRIAAFIIDFLVLFVIAVAMFLGNAKSIEGAGAFSDNACDIVDVNFCIDNGDDLIVMSDSDFRNLYLVDLGVWVANIIVLQSITGGSLGKLILGVRVVDKQGQKANAGRVIVRSLMLIVDTVCFYLPGLISSLTTKGHKRLGDMVAGTFVVRKDRVGEPPLPELIAAPAWTPAPGYAPPPSGPPPSAPPPAGPPPGAWDAPPPPAPAPPAPPPPEAPPPPPPPAPEPPPPSSGGWGQPPPPGQ